MDDTHTQNNGTHTNGAQANASNADAQKAAPPNVLMYATGTCPYCINAERLLVSKGVEINKIRVDLQPELRQEMMQKTGRRTVPQIYIDALHVGGYDDLRALDLAGKLDPLLKI